MASNPSSEPSEAAGAVRGDGSPFTPLWAKVDFPMTSLPNRPAPRRPPPAGVFTDLNLKSGFWGRLGGVIPCSRGLVGTSGARSFHLGHNILLPLASIQNFQRSKFPLGFVGWLTQIAKVTFPLFFSAPLQNFPCCAQLLGFWGL